VVEGPQRVEARDPRGGALLPVDPPEIDALLLERVMQLLQVGADEVGVADVEDDRLLGVRVGAGAGGDGPVGLLVRPDAGGGVHIEGHRQAAVVQFRQEGRRVGKEVPVPGVAGPAVPVTGGDVDEVPVHVEDGHAERQPLGLEGVEQFAVLLGGVGVIAAPPVAERGPRQQGRRAGQSLEVAHRPGDVPPVGEDVEVEVAAAGSDPPVLGQGEGVRVVQGDDPEGAGEARFQGAGSVDGVQGAGRAAQVERHLHLGDHLAVPPQLVVVLPGGRGDRQPARREGAAVVLQGERGRPHQEAGALPDDRELRGREVAVEHDLGGPVLEGPVGRVLQAQQPLGQDGHPPAVARDDGRRRRERVGVQQGRRAEREPGIEGHPGILGERCGSPRRGSGARGVRAG